jgi:hypothetical protein
MTQKQAIDVPLNSYPVNVRLQGHRGETAMSRTQGWLGVSA